MSSERLTIPVYLANGQLGFVYFDEMEDDELLEVILFDSDGNSKFVKKSEVIW